MLHYINTITATRGVLKAISFLEACLVGSLLLATSPTELRLFNHISIVLFLRHIPLMQPMIAIGSNVEPNGAPLTC